MHVINVAKQDETQSKDAHPKSEQQPSLFPPFNLQLQHLSALTTHKTHDHDDDEDHQTPP